MSRLTPSTAPSSADDLAEALHEAGSNARTVAVIGNGSKHLMSGPVLPSDVVISTAGLRRVLQYEPNDLTISVEAGMPFSELQSILARRKQMVALDPPFSLQATVGGVVASNSNGPMRRGFGTARDLVIGMTFAMLDGKLVKTGGMVVKNVAGLDMGKLLVGSFGTLAILTSVNFRLHALPVETRTFLFTFRDLEAALEKRDSILASVLQPIAIDLASPAAAARLGYRGFLLAVRASGSPAVIQRYARDLSATAELSGDRDIDLWQQIREFTPEFLARQPTGIVLRISTPLTGLAPLMRLVSGASISRAGSGVTYVYLSSWHGVSPLWKTAAEQGWSAVVEFAPDDLRSANELWHLPSSTGRAEAFAMMEKVKRMFDPHNLLNRGRLYGRI
ncbi:MAG: FAD-binding oxidoreductase [Bryobacteraceae bacterium]